MSDLIDREDLLKHVGRVLGRWSHMPGNAYVTVDITNTLKALPAAVPMVDVVYDGAYYETASWLEHDGHRKPTPGETTQHYAERMSRAILSAGYVGSVSVEDVRMVATNLLPFDGGVCPCVACAAAKRLLAATEGK